MPMMIMIVIIICYAEKLRPVNNGPYRIGYEPTVYRILQPKGGLLK